ncbi:divergent polysaccharide deacetylase family protein [Rhodospirillaceae bacterium SYSU D60014]|uniref:divergent polysaccharide deacetylase family protein n=1 Tax=Virgifigura deserti TaxID=2268457 RepID=UPI0013C420B7
MSQPPQATRRGGWGALICALLILAVVGVAAAWLRYTGELVPLLSATPQVEVALPPLDEIPLETAELEEAPAQITVPKATASEAAAPEAAVPEAEKAETQLPVAAVEPPMASDKQAQEPVVIPAAPALPIAEQASAEAAEPPPAPGSAVEQAPVEQADMGPQVAAATLRGVAPPGVALPAWQRFARPFEADNTRPRIAVIVAELGLSEGATRAAIQRLPVNVTLSFSPYARNLQEWIDTARADGHEVMLDLPMEPVSFPRDDPGPKALLTSLSVAENRARLTGILDQAEGYVGVVPWMGSRFTTSAEDLRPILRSLGDRGLMFVDPRVAPGSVAARVAREAEVPRAINDRFLDHEASRVAIDGRLMQIEHQARTTGFAVAMASPYPITIESLDQWVRTLDRKGLVLAPVSALADQQEEQ